MWMPNRNSQQGILVVEEFQIGEALHPKYGMPVTVSDTSWKYIVLPSQVSPQFLSSLGQF